MENYIEALQKVPEVHLAIFDLARQVFKEDGALDMEKASFLNAEILQAAKVARVYSEETERAVHLLWGLMRSQP